MSTTIWPRIPAWLAGSTVALVIAAAARVADAAGFAGILELMQLLFLIGFCALALLLAERYEAHVADVYWPSPKFRKLVFVALLVVLDGYLAVIFLRGGTFVGSS